VRRTRGQDNATIRGGDQIFPRRLIFNLDWMAKNNSESLINEDRAGRPNLSRDESHEDMACIEYARIDCSFCDERPQAWEINTAPTDLTIRRLTSIMLLLLFLG
jgi:hypothetical protein